MTKHSTGTVTKIVFHFSKRIGWGDLVVYFLENTQYFEPIQLTLWSRVFIEKLIVTQLDNKFPTFH